MTSLDDLFGPDLAGWAGVEHDDDRLFELALDGLVLVLADRRP